MSLASTRSPLPSIALRNLILDVEEPQGGLQVYMPTAQVMVTRAHGNLSLQQSEAWIHAMRPYMAKRVKIAGFHDWLEAKSYDSAARKALTEWMLSHRESVAGGWFLTASRLVAMGVTVTGTFTAFAGISMHASCDPAVFDKRLREALA
ncbi:MAG: hypothetical protein Q8Q09_16935 [Deltaproteobacteria bacterium]|nr:hypothetical protein [Deltaproteobacteria bacterium]